MWSRPSIVPPKVSRSRLLGIPTPMEGTRVESNVQELLAESEVLEHTVSRVEVAVDGAQKARRTAKDIRQRAAAVRRSAHRIRAPRLSTSARASHPAARAPEMRGCPDGAAASRSLRAAAIPRDRRQANGLCRRGQW